MEGVCGVFFRCGYPDFFGVEISRLIWVMLTNLTLCFLEEIQKKKKTRVFGEQSGAGGTASVVCVYVDPRFSQPGEYDRSAVQAGLYDMLRYITVSGSVTRPNEFDLGGLLYKLCNMRN